MSLAFFLLAPVGALVAQQAYAHEPVAVAPAEMTWTEAPPVLPSGAKIAVLAGNPQKKGPFVFRLKFPDNYEIPAHTHSMAELLTVISGTFNFGHGEVLDRSKTKALSAGAFVEIPPQHAHYVWTQGETVVQVNGEGPFNIKYLDPAKDPMARQASK